MRHLQLALQQLGWGRCRVPRGTSIDIGQPPGVLHPSQGSKRRVSQHLRGWEGIRDGRRLFWRSMTLTSDATAAMHLPRPRHTLRLAGREWRHNQRSVDAFELAAKRDGRQTVTVRASYGRPEEETERWSLWRKEPDLMRAEFTVGGETVEAVWRGHTWWSSSPTRGYQTNNGRPNYGHGIGPADALLDPAKLLPVVDLQVREKTSLLDRPTYRLTARPRPAEWPRAGVPIAPVTLGAGGDEYELMLDPESGLLLRTEARLSDIPFRVIEVEELAVDTDMPSRIFELAPGAEFRDGAEHS